MENNKVAIHTKAVNLARRWSVQNENDLLQEDMFGNNYEIGTSPGSHRQYDYVYCSELAQHLVSSKSLPSECMKFKDLYSDLKRRDTDNTHPSQILS